MACNSYIVCTAYNSCHLFSCYTRPVWQPQLPVLCPGDITIHSASLRQLQPRRKALEEAPLKQHHNFWVSTDGPILSSLLAVELGPPRCPAHQWSWFCIHCWKVHFYLRITVMHELCQDKYIAKNGHFSFITRRGQGQGIGLNPASLPHDKIKVSGLHRVLTKG